MEKNNTIKWYSVNEIVSKDKEYFIKIQERDTGKKFFSERIKCCKGEKENGKKGNC